MEPLQYELIDGADYFSWQSDAKTTFPKTIRIAGKTHDDIVIMKKTSLNALEMRQLCELRHESIIETLGYCDREHPKPFLSQVMSNLSMSKFTSVVENLDSERLEESHVWFGYIMQLYNGIQYLHERNYRHGDLKPDNIFVDPEKHRIKIVDLNSLFENAISEPWTAPECLGTLRDRDLIHKEDDGSFDYSRSQSSIKTDIRGTDKMDIWSFGVIVWQLIFRIRPYKGISNSNIGTGVREGRLRLPLGGNDKFPTEAFNLIEECQLSKPENRPSTKRMYGMLLQTRRQLATKSREVLDPQEWKLITREWHQQGAAFLERDFVYCFHCKEFREQMECEQRHLEEEHRHMREQIDEGSKTITELLARTLAPPQRQMPATVGPNRYSPNPDFALFHLLIKRRYP